MAGLYRHPRREPLRLRQSGGRVGYRGRDRRRGRKRAQQAHNRRRHRERADHPCGRKSGGVRGHGGVDRPNAAGHCQEADAGNSGGVKNRADRLGTHLRGTQARNRRVCERQRHGHVSFCRGVGLRGERVWPGVCRLGESPARAAENHGEGVGDNAAGRCRGRQADEKGRPRDALHSACPGLRQARLLRRARSGALGGADGGAAERRNAGRGISAAWRGKTPVPRGWCSSIRARRSRRATPDSARAPMSSSPDCDRAKTVGRESRESRSCS